MTALIQTVILALDLYWWIIIASAIFSWLFAFNVVNPRNQVVNTIGNALYRLTEPALRPSAVSCRIWEVSTFRRSSSC